MKVLTVVGARPQFIKAGTLSRYINNIKGIDEIIVHTGQHYDNKMSDIFFQEMMLPKPNYNLDIGGLGHGEMTGKMIEKLEPILLDELPDWVLIYGDTNSTLAGAITASKLNIRVAHIEAGLRSYNMKMPEEVNRIIADRVSNVLFCPTEIAVNNLNKEGYDFINAKVINVGDIMYEGTLFYSKLKKKPKKINLDSFILATIHRAENTNEKSTLQSILGALNYISKTKKVILPLHPRTKNSLIRYKLKFDNIEFIDPVGYLEMNWLLDQCEFVMTDSGGLQKEAYFYKKPCITLRKETEWKELTQNNVNILVGDDPKKIIQSSNLSWVNHEGFEKMLYGDGRTSEKIIKSLKST